MTRLLSSLWPAIAAVALVLIAASCGGGGAGEQAVTVIASEYKFDPANITVQANKPARLTVRNAGSVEHSWTIEGKEKEVNTGYIQPGQSKTISFTIDQPGTYTVYCDVPGHRELGMVGQLTVR